MKKSTLKRAAAVTLAALMAGSVLAGCGGGASSSNTDATKAESSKTESKADATGGKVYFLNFKPEQDEAWQNLAKAYTEETGVPVTVQTAAEGTYEQTLTSEMNKTDAPTLFQVNGPVGLAKWEDFCKDLKDTEIYKQLTSTDYALEKDGQTLGIAYLIETYGLIYNKALLNKYFESDFASVKTIDELNSFEALKKVADEIQANAEALGVKGAFSSPGMDASSDWRFKTHLANLPIYFEYKEDKIDDTDAIKGTFLDNYKNIFDLYITDTTCKPTELASKTGDESREEFAKGEAVFYQNGTWEYNGLIDAGMKAEDLGMLPIYIGAGDEANQGLCTGTENYWCVNANASEADQAATEAFMNWCVTSDKGTKAMAEDMGFTIPFKAAKETPNVFVKADADYLAAGKTPVSWNFTTMPSEDWKNGVGAALTQYAAGTGDWDAVKTAFVDGWKTEKEKAAE
ncbi:MAG: ABC transporter substrate-binding protein [Ruminococcus sp.]|nr:ABC transporter substrate-binding protein [Ruminococcus sp.]